MPRKDPTKPKGLVSAYAWFVKDKQGSIEVPTPKNGDKKQMMCERSKVLSAMWKELDEDDKKEYRELADKDKKRHEGEMATWRATAPADGASKKKGKKSAAKKDPTKPKKNLTAFFFFSNKFRPEVKAEYPTYRVGDIAKELGKRWGALDEDDKRPYVQDAEKDKERYECELELWKRGEFSQIDEQAKEEEEDDDDDYSDAED